jgi:hypothetical protein
MASRDLLHNLGVVQLSPPTDQHAASFTSKVLDTGSFESAMVLIEIGGFTGETGSNYFTFTLQESDDTIGADFTTVGTATPPTPSGSPGPSDVQQPGSFQAGNPNFVEVTGANATVVINAAGTINQVYALGYFGRKRYVRVNAVLTGTLTLAQVSIVGLLGHAQIMPVTSPAAITAS